MTENRIANWLLSIADYVERFPAMPTAQRDRRAGIIIETPTQAMLYAAGRIRDFGEREVVVAALPTSETDDFAEAARLIREAAARTR